MKKTFKKLVFLLCMTAMATSLTSLPGLAVSGSGNVKNPGTEANMVFASFSAVPCSKLEDIPAGEGTSEETCDHIYDTDPAFTWTEDNTCAAVFTCSTCGDTQEKTCTIEVMEHTDATCKSEGKNVYTASVTLDSKTYTNKKTEILPKTSHVCNTKPSFSWSSDYTTCFATYICASCKESQTVECTVTNQQTPATCQMEGSMVYTATADINGTTYTDEKTAVLEKIPHTYDTDPAFTWTDDNTCTAVFTCSACGDKQEKACTVEVTEHTDASCKSEGKNVYTASVTLDSKTYTNKKTEILPKTSHVCNTTPSFAWSDNYDTCSATYVCATCGKLQTVSCTITSQQTPATCQVEGSMVYTATADINGTTYTDEKTVVLEKIPHTYGKPEFQWADDGSTCTATFTCSICNESLDPIACTVTHETTPASCEKEGKTVYTASVTFEGKPYTNTKTIVIEKTPHTYDTDPTFQWSEDGTCKAIFACSKCPDKHTENCTVEVTEHTDATCQSEGKTVYTASVTFEGKKHVNTKTIIIEKKPHSYGKPNFQWANDGTCQASFVCSACKDTQTINCDVASAEEGGFPVYTASCTLDGQTYTDFPLAGIALNKAETSLIEEQTETLTITYYPAATTAEKTITWRSDNEAVATVENGTITAVSEGTAVITATTTNGKTASCTITITSKVTPVDEIFTDVHRSDWFFSKVQYVYDNNLMSGFNATTFAPYKSMNRAMVVQILYNYEKEKGTLDTSKEGVSFSDVSSKYWYYEAISWASANGVAAGYSDGTFKPNAVVTREQFAQFLYNYDGKPPVSGTLSFPDKDSVSGWAQDAILWATQNKFINGKSQADGTALLDPQGKATRAEAASILTGFVESLK